MDNPSFVSNSVLQRTVNERSPDEFAARGTVLECIREGGPEVQIRSS
jgi:hypothetical protein